MRVKRSVREREIRQVIGQESGGRGCSFCVLSCSSPIEILIILLGCLETKDILVLYLRTINVYDVVKFRIMTVRERTINVYDGVKSRIRIVRETWRTFQL